MKELIWCTDIHLDHARPEATESFVRKVDERDGVVLLGGDLSNGAEIVKHLTYMSKAWPNKQIYFVLGNHDYYSSSFDEVWYNVAECVSECDNLHWLDRSGPIKLTDKTALVGSGLWCDWAVGKEEKSIVWLHDYNLIEDLRFPGAQYKEWTALDNTKKKVRYFAKFHTEQLMRDFNKAVEQGFKNIVVLSHYPPFYEGSFHDGRLQDDDWSPHFVCVMAGQQLKEAVQKLDDVKVTALCGHTHGSGDVNILPNLRVINGPAKYRKPAPQEPIMVE
jgi:3',5'-cyclic-AMP phosphodiesterase